jgi:hypothetical protein
MFMAAAAFPEAQNEVQEKLDLVIGSGKGQYFPLFFLTPSNLTLRSQGKPPSCFPRSPSLWEVRIWASFHIVHIVEQILHRYCTWSDDGYYLGTFRPSHHSLTDANLKILQRNYYIPAGTIFFDHTSVEHS